MATDTATKDATTTATSHQFQAEVAKLLHLMVHSVYSDRDVFLRELISNAADALDKLRYEAIANPALLEGQPDLTITITTDKDKKTLTITDQNGRSPTAGGKAATRGTRGAAGVGSGRRMSRARSWAAPSKRTECTGSNSARSSSCRILSW